MKLLRFMSLLGVVLLASSIVRADDTRVNNSGGGDPILPACGSNVFSSNSGGVLQFSCLVTSTESGGTGTLKMITDEAPDSADGGALQCASTLATVDGWKETQTINPGGIDTCKLTAPTSVSWQTKLKLMLLGDPYKGHNDHDCDLDDFVLGIPVGCALNIDNFNVAGNPNSGTSPFADDAPFGVAGNNDSLPQLPEPGTLSLVLIGLAGLPLVRRKRAR